jgi:hypothetical protein
MVTWQHTYGSSQLVTTFPITPVHCPVGHVLLAFSHQGSPQFPHQTREAGHPEDLVSNEFNTSPEDGALMGKLVHLALPVRWTPVGQTKGPFETACTYDVHPRGARLLGGRDINVGDMIMVERGRNKSLCQVVWTADPSSPLRGQFTVRCVDNARAPWEEELRQMEEQYQPVIVDGAQQNFRGVSHGNANRPDANRRRRPRFYAEGEAEVIDGSQRVAGEVSQISECGARITGPRTLNPGTNFRLMLNMFDVSLVLKARVRYLVENLGMGVEFQEIRRGDGPLLSYVMSRLRTRKVEDFAPVVVVAESLAAAG